jgi:hypothetical protein
MLSPPDGNYDRNKLTGFKRNNNITAFAELNDSTIVCLQAFTQPIQMSKEQLFIQLLQILPTLSEDEAQLSSYISQSCFLHR